MYMYVYVFTRNSIQSAMTASFIPVYSVVPLSQPGTSSQDAKAGRGRDESRGADGAPLHLKPKRQTHLSLKAELLDHGLNLGTLSPKPGAKNALFLKTHTPWLAKREQCSW